MKEFLGEKAVRELFDIIAENYVSQEEFETREKNLASSVSVGAALIAVALLKVAEAIITAKGGEGGEMVDEKLIETDSEVNEVLSKYFKFAPTQTDEQPKNNESVDEDHIATDEEVQSVLGKYFKQ